MSEITQSLRRIDLRQMWAVSGLVLRGVVRVTKATARVTWAVLKSLGQLAVYMMFMAGGGAALWWTAQTLLSDDATIVVINHGSAVAPAIMNEVRRIGQHEIDRPGLKSGHCFNAVALNDGVVRCHGVSLLGWLWLHLLMQPWLRRE